MTVNARQDIYRFAIIYFYLQYGTVLTQAGAADRRSPTTLLKNFRSIEQISEASFSGLFCPYQLGMVGPQIAL
jgi:hypothetical protein